MKVIKTTTAEPTLTIELTLTEVKMLRDLVGSHSPNEFRDRIEKKDGLNIHPNFGEKIHALYGFFYKAAKDTVEAASPTER